MSKGRNLQRCSPNLDAQQQQLESQYKLQRTYHNTEVHATRIGELLISSFVCSQPRSSACTHAAISWELECLLVFAYNDASDTMNNDNGS